MLLNRQVPTRLGEELIENSVSRFGYLYGSVRLTLRRWRFSYRYRHGTHLLGAQAMLWPPCTALHDHPPLHCIACLGSIRSSSYSISTLYVRLYISLSVYVILTGTWLVAPSRCSSQLTPLILVSIRDLLTPLQNRSDCTKYCVRHTSRERARVAGIEAKIAYCNWNYFGVGASKNLIKNLVSGYQCCVSRTEYLAGQTMRPIFYDALGTKQRAKIIH